MSLSTDSELWAKGRMKLNKTLPSYKCDSFLLLSYFLSLYSFMHVTVFNLYLTMPFHFESSIIDLLLCPPAQDEFKSWRLEQLLVDYMSKVHSDQIEDVLQILHKCIGRLERIRNLKQRYKLNV